MTRLPIAFSVLLFATSLRAQTAPCQQLNGTTASVGTALTANLPGGPNTFAFRVTFNFTSTLRGLQIFTGNTQVPGFMKLEVWREDPVTMLPLSRWSGGTWQVSPALGNSWQGADVDYDIANWTLPVWIVWTEPGASTEPYEPGGVAVPAAQLIGGVWVPLPPAALKLRIFNAWLDGAHVTTSGFACVVGPPWPYRGTAFTNQPPAVGNPAFAVEGSGFAAGQLAVLVLGTNPNGQPPFPWLWALPPTCLLPLDYQLALWAVTGTGDVRANAATGAAAHVTFPMPIPPNGLLAGLRLYSMIGAVNPGATAPLPFQTSNNLVFDLF